MAAEPITYGRLTEAARRQAAQAAVPRQLPVVVDQVVRDAAGLMALLALIGRHARFLGLHAGRDNVASELHHRIETLLTEIRPLLPETPVGEVGVWAAAIGSLGAAHDLLAAQVGPRGEPRGPDAIALRHPDAVDTATGRLVGLVGVLIEAADRRAGRLRDRLLEATSASGKPDGGRRPDSDGPAAVLRTAQALDRLAWLRSPMLSLDMKCGAAGRVPALDEVVPLLGDRGLPGFELTLERFRYAAHSLTYPGTRPHRRPLVALASAAATFAAGAEDLVARYAEHHRPPRRALFTDVVMTAGQARLAWELVSMRLRPLQSAGIEGRHLAEAADQARRSVQARLHANSTMARLPAGLADARRAALLLPELAAVAEFACGRLAAEGLLVTATDTAAVESGRLLVEACAEAVNPSQRLVVACASLPGPQPLPGRARLLGDPRLGKLINQTRAPRSASTAVAESSRQLIWLQDPRLGVLPCDARLFEQALGQSDQQLWDLVRPHAVQLRLTGTESRPALAALAARLAPEHVASLATPVDATQAGHRSGAGAVDVRAADDMETGLGL